MTKKDDALNYLVHIKVNFQTKVLLQTSTAYLLALTSLALNVTLILDNTD